MMMMLFWGLMMTLLWGWAFGRSTGFADSFGACAILGPSGCNASPTRSLDVSHGSAPASSTLVRTAALHSIAHPP